MTNLSQPASVSSLYRGGQYEALGLHASAARGCRGHGQDERPSRHWINIQVREGGSVRFTHAKLAAPASGEFSSRDILELQRINGRQDSQIEWLVEIHRVLSCSRFLSLTLVDLEPV